MFIMSFYILQIYDLAVSWSVMRENSGFGINFSPWHWADLSIIKQPVSTLLFVAAIRYSN